MEWLKGRRKPGIWGIKATINTPIFNTFCHIVQKNIYNLLKMNHKTKKLKPEDRLC